MKLVLIILCFMFLSVNVWAQEQYQYDPTKLTPEQQHMLKQVKQEQAQQAKHKNLQQYRDEAKNPSKYRIGETYNKQRKSY